MPIAGAVVDRLVEEGHEIVLSARDHAQTAELARSRWPDVVVAGDESPPGRAAKGLAVLRRAEVLRRFARNRRPDVAFSHGSYAQIVAARAARIPVVTMMDYEHQPANHLSFRLAQRVIVPEIFPEDGLRRCGGRPRKVIRYPGFKEELYLTGFEPDATVLGRLALDTAGIIAVFRPPPEGALYHRMANDRFDEILRTALGREDVQVVLLPRTATQFARYAEMSARVRIPDRPVDGGSLLALADLTVGAGGTMNRESAVLGTPTYSVFLGKLAAVDAELMRLGRLQDLRAPGTQPRFAKKDPGSVCSAANAETILAAVLGALQHARRDS